MTGMKQFFGCAVIGAIVADVLLVSARTVSRGRRARGGRPRRRLKSRCWPKVWARCR